MRTSKRRVVALAAMLLTSATVAAVTSAPVAAQNESGNGTSPILEDDLTEAGGAFSGEGGDVAEFEFGRDGMTVTASNPDRSLYLKPNTSAPEDALLNAAVEVDVKVENKKTGVGIFCRRSDVHGGYLFWVKGKRFQVFGRDDETSTELVELSSGRVKGFKATKVNTVRAECERQSQNGFSIILTLSVNGKELMSRLEDGAPGLGSVGLFLEGLDGGSASATFSDLVIEELPPPTS